MAGCAAILITLAGSRHLRDWSRKTTVCDRQLTMNLIILIIVIILLIGALPTWPYSADWGYYPSGGLGLVLLILIILFLLGRI